MTEDNSKAHPALEREVTITLKLKYVHAAFAALQEANRQANLEASFLSDQGMLTTQGKLGYAAKLMVYEKTIKVFEDIVTANITAEDNASILAAAHEAMERTVARVEADEERSNATVQ